MKVAATYAGAPAFQPKCWWTTCAVANDADVWPDGKAWPPPLGRGRSTAILRPRDSRPFITWVRIRSLPTCATSRLSVSPPIPHVPSAIPPIVHPSPTMRPIDVHDAAGFVTVHRSTGPSELEATRDAAPPAARITTVSIVAIRLKSWPRFWTIWVMGRSGGGALVGGMFACGARAALTAIKKTAETTGARISACQAERDAEGHGRGERSGPSGPVVRRRDARFCVRQLVFAHH